MKSEITQHRFKRNCQCQVGKSVVIRGDIYSTHVQYGDNLFHFLSWVSYDVTPMDHNTQSAHKKTVCLQYN